VIEVSVGDKDIRDLEKTPRREGADVPEIEHEGSPLPGESDVQGRVPEQVVDKEGAKATGHLPTTVTKIPPTLPSPAVGGGPGWGRGFHPSW
jgi:hypothetical protein